jgi:hypothetical protein
LVGGPYSYNLFNCVQHLGNISTKRRMAALMASNQMAIDPDLSQVINRTKV